MTRPLCGEDMLGRLLDLSGRSLNLEAVNTMHAARTAMNWRMGAKLFARMRAQGHLAIFSDDTRAQLQNAHLSTVMRNRVLRRATLRLLRLLDQANLPPLVLKGGVELLSTPEAGACTRFMEDIDLLLPLEQCRQAEALLLAQGYLPDGDHHTAGQDHHGPEFRDPSSGLRVEIHVWPIKFHRPAFLAAMLADATRLDLGCGLSVRVPSPRYQILHNMIHTQESHAAFVLGLADLRQLYEFAEKCTAMGDSLDWPWMLAEADAIGLRSHLLSYAYAARRIFHLPLPASLTFRLSERHQARHIRNQEFRPHALNSAERVLLYHWFVLDGLFSLGDLARYYRYWAARARQLVFKNRPALEPSGGWPLGYRKPSPSR